MEKTFYFLFFVLGFVVALFMVQPYFLPDNSQQVVLDTLRGALFSVDIVVFSLYPSDITQIIRDKALNGVKVRVVVNRNTFDFEEARNLDALDNVEVRVYRGKLHSKFYIIDNYVVLVGSNNISKSALFKNKEAGVKLLILHVWDYIAEFERIWADSEPISSFS